MDTLETSLSPGVSIIIVSFKETQRLRDTLASIPIDCDDIEVILVTPRDDHSALELVADSKIDSIRVVHDLGLGVYQAMNLGIRSAKFSHLLFLNTGDLITGHSQVALCLSKISKNPERSFVLPVSALWSNEIDNAVPDLTGFLEGLANNYVSHQGVIFSTIFARSRGIFDENYVVSADFKQLCILHRSNQFTSLDVKLVSIEFPKYSAKYNRRGRFETFLIIVSQLQGSVRMKALISRMRNEIKFLTKKFSQT